MLLKENFLRTEFYYNLIKSDIKDRKKGQKRWDNKILENCWKKGNSPKGKFINNYLRVIIMLLQIPTPRFSNKIIYLIILKLIFKVFMEFFFETL